MLSTNSAAKALDLSIRSRIASLEEGDQSGKAGSVRARISWHQPWSPQINTLLELDAITEIWAQDFSNGVRFNGKPDLPDVEGMDINQAKLQLKLSAAELEVGRQTINFKDERFIGSVSIWQNEQSFDAARLHFSLFTQSAISYSYINRAHRIFGRDAEKNLQPSDINFESNKGIRPAANLGEHELKTHALWLDYNEWDYSKLSAFAYDYKNQDAPSLSNKTAGAIYQIKYRPAQWTYSAELIAAYQERTQIQSKPNTDFYRIEMAVGIQSLQIAFRRESLGTSNNKEGVSFITPLASLHDHQGWNDHFTITPPEGIVDSSLRLLWRKQPWRFALRYHYFEPEEKTTSALSDRFGEEIDMDIEWDISKKQNLHLRTAHFFQSKAYKNRFADASRVILTYNLKF